MRRTRKTLAMLGLLGLLAAAGCGSSTKSSTSSASASSTPTSTTASASGSQSTASGANPFTIGPVPAVTGGTDLTKEPKVAAGTGTVPTTLTGQDLVTGTGAMPSASSTVKVQYVGVLYATGMVFDASWTDQGPASFPLSGVVPGFRDAILGMKVGGRREVVIPPDLGYGAAGSPPVIPPNATLVFVIDLLSVS
ncbi:MAG: FKBP-type peptidyl-prolyl cis-trans isomerase [Acidimicrobiales bacterium]